MSTLLYKLQNAAQHYEAITEASSKATAEAEAKQEEFLGIRAKAQFLECQKVAAEKLSKGEFILEKGTRRVCVLHERCTLGLHGHNAPLTDLVERFFNSEGIRTDRCYGGTDIYTGCELILLIPA